MPWITNCKFYLFCDFLFLICDRNSLIVKPQVAAIDFSNVRPDSLDIEDFGVENYADDDYVAENNENRA